MSSARIPLLSGDLPFWVCWLQFATLLSWSLGFLSSHRCCCSARLCCCSCHRHPIHVLNHLAHCSKDICNSFSRCDAFSFLVFFIFVMSTLFFADLIPGIFVIPLKSSWILWMSICLFILFLSLMHLFMHSLTSFSLCFSPLGVFLLSSMSLRISASWNTIEPASSPWCGKRAPRCSTALRSGCSSSFFAVVRHASSSFIFPLSCHLVASAAVAVAAACAGCGRPTVLTPVLTQSWNTPSVCLRATALHVSSFNFLCFFQLVLLRPSLFLCFSFFCGGGIFLLFRRFLGIFFRARAIQYWCFFSLCTSFMFFRVVFFSYFYD